jgi:hypothetical protein
VYAAALRWRLLPGQCLRHQRWHDECVVFNDLTGDTHLLDAVVLELLLAIQQEPIAVDELPDAASLLDRLAALGLIELVLC